MREPTKFSKYGPGGRRCTCCGPAPENRAKHDRMVMKRIRRDGKRIIREAVAEHMSRDD